MLFDILNVLRNKVTQEEINEILFNMGIICTTEINIMENAVKNAYKYDLSVYDGIFLAADQHYRGRLITDDEKLFNSCCSKSRENGVILLKDYV